jgi:adenylate cyclase
MGCVTIDFDSEALLKGTRGRAREERLRLLEELADQGVALEELRSAVEQNRLALVPVERVLEGDGERITAEEVGERAGLDGEFLLRYWQALGLPRPEPDQRIFTERDLEAAKAVVAFREAGLPDEGILDATRVLGMSMAQVAATIRALIAETFIEGSDSERELALAFRDQAGALEPVMGGVLHHVFRLHVREQMRQDAIGLAELAEGRLTGGQEVSVGFADMVEFTRLGERLEPEELGELTGRLGELSTDLVEAPVRIVKLLGDAVMMVSPENEPLLDAALALVEAAEGEGERFPQLRAGVARGEALPRTGDWYGRPVNLASRITSIARPGSVLCDEATREDAGDGYEWSFAGSRRLKGIKGGVKLYRCRRGESDGEDQ